MKKHRRLKIPDDVKLKLWVFSGGRCEFPGCNKPVWRDGLTLKDDNFAEMSHIVAASPSGPRGDKKNSPLLARDFSNLLLVCRIHAKLVDGKHKSDYSIDDLREFKKRHEDRIRIQTAVDPGMSTTVVRFIANVGDRKMEISVPQTYQAIKPFFPSNEKGIVFDYSNMQGAGDKQYLEGIARDVATKVKLEFSPGNDYRLIDHLSVFAIGPIPLLAFFGNCIGGTIHADVYQKHRNSDDWKWKKEFKGDKFKYIIKKRNLDVRGSKVVLIISLSGVVQRDEVARILPDSPSYEITISKPDRDYLQRRSQLDKFASCYRKLLAEIRKRHGSQCEIYLFPAMPAAIAVLCGRELLPKADPIIHIYDLDKNQGGFVEGLTIN